VYGLDVIGLGHGALDADAERYQIAVLDQRRQSDFYFAGFDWGRVHELADDIGHVVGRDARELGCGARWQHRSDCQSARSRQKLTARSVFHLIKFFPPFMKTRLPCSRVERGHMGEHND